jgi:hypothetical protein
MINRAAIRDFDPGAKAMRQHDRPAALIGVGAERGIDRGLIPRRPLFLVHPPFRTDDPAAGSHHARAVACS